MKRLIEIIFIVAVTYVLIIAKKQIGFENIMIFIMVCILFELIDLGFKKK